MSERASDVRLPEITNEPFLANGTVEFVNEANSPKQFLNPSPCQRFIMWDFVHFSGCGILSVGILSCGILSCGILSGYRMHAFVNRRINKLDSC